jgi:hypothetical protein
VRRRREIFPGAESCLEGPDLLLQPVDRLLELLDVGGRRRALQGNAGGRPPDDEGADEGERPEKASHVSLLLSEAVARSVPEGRING